MPVESRFIQVGEHAPAFTLPAVSGEQVSLAQFEGEKQVVLVFLRGFM